MPFYVRKRPLPSSTATALEKKASLSPNQVRLLLGCYMGYCSMMFSRATLDVAIPLILQDQGTGIGPRDIGTLLTLCSFFYLFGKISMGYSVDNVGPRFVFLWLASFASAALTCLISLSSNAWRMTFIMCLLCVAQSSGWAAMTSLVSLWLQPSQFAMAFGFLSTSSRMGDLASKVILGAAVAGGWQWRSLFLVAAVVQLCVALLNSVLLPKHLPSSSSPSLDSPRRPHGAGSLANDDVPSLSLSSSSSSSSSSDASLSLTQVWVIVRSPRFISIAVAIAALHTVMEFDKYIPLYLHRSLHLSPGLAAQGAALYPFSQLLALGIAGVGYDRLGGKGRLYTIGSLCLAVAVFYALQLALYAASSSPRTVVPDSVHLALLFMAGSAVAVPYYLPPSIYLAEVGGKGKCGTLSGLLDASGGATSMVFHYCMGHLVTHDQWGLLLGVLSLCGLVGFAAMSVFHHLSLGRRQQSGQQKKNPDLYIPTQEGGQSQPTYSFRTGTTTSSSSSATIHHHHHHARKAGGGLAGGLRQLAWYALGGVGVLASGVGGWVRPGAKGLVIDRRKERKDSGDYLPHATV